MPANSDKCVSCSAVIAAHDRVVLRDGDMFHEACFVLTTAREQLAASRRVLAAAKQTASETDGFLARRRPWVLITAPQPTAKRLRTFVETVGVLTTAVYTVDEALAVARVIQFDGALLDGALVPDRLSAFVVGLRVPAGRLVLVGELSDSARQNAQALGVPLVLRDSLDAKILGLIVESLRRGDSARE
jgi:hypothetical protein